MTTLSKMKPISPSSSPGGYNWDSGCVAFADPLALIGKKREKERLRESKKNKKQRVTLARDSKKDFHTKHG